MQKQETIGATGIRHKWKSAAITAAAAMLGALMIMLLAALAIEKGYLPENYDGRLVMLCIFLGTFLSSILRCKREDRGLLKSAAISSLLFGILLIGIALCSNSDRVFCEQYLKNEISATAGFFFGSAICAFKKPKIHGRRR